MDFLSHNRQVVYLRRYIECGGLGGGGGRKKLGYFSSSLLDTQVDRRVERKRGLIPDHQKGALPRSCLIFWFLSTRPRPSGGTTYRSFSQASRQHSFRNLTWLNHPIQCFRGMLLPRLLVFGVFSGSGIASSSASSIVGGQHNGIGTPPCG